MGSGWRKEAKAARLRGEADSRSRGSRRRLDLDRRHHKHGIDKAYGIGKLIALLDAAKQDVIFVGDRLSKGGNDYPVKAMGVDCLAVSCWQDTALVIQTMLGVT